MEKNILKKVDLTLLKVNAKDGAYKELVETAHYNDCASVCVPPCRVGMVKSFIREKKWDIPICTVVGFPNGYNTTAIKVAEAVEAVKNGASEIDMVVNLDAFANSKYDLCKSEIQAVVRSVKSTLPTAIVKVIVESAALSEYDIELLCKMCAEAGADYIKTSTGFHPAGGATMEAVMAMKRTIDNHNLNLKIKASGGIKTLEQFISFSRICDRIGASNVDAIS